MANSISVAVGESDTIRLGRERISTSPLAAFTVTGNLVPEGLFVDSGLVPPVHPVAIKQKMKTPRSLRFI